MVTFRYELAGFGWADAFLSDGTNSVEIPASYICDALGDFSEAVVRLLSEDRSACGWLEEPGFAAWSFARTDLDLLITVEWLDEWPDEQTDLLTSDPQQRHGKKLFSGTTDLLSFVTQVEQSLQKILDTLGKEGYEKEWERPFPTKAQQVMQQWLANFPRS